MWTKTVPYTMFQLPVYDVVSSALKESAAGLAASVAAAGAGGVLGGFLVVGGAVPPVLIQLPASLIAAVCAALVSQPGDTLLSTINKGSAGKMLAAGTVPCISDACPSGDFDVAVAVGDSPDACRIDFASSSDFGASASAAAASSTTTSSAATASTVTLEQVETQTVVVVEGAPALDDRVVWDGDEFETGTGTEETRKGLLELAVELGPGGLMTGFNERLLHVASIICIQLVCYDNIKHALHLIP